MRLDTTVMYSALWLAGCMWLIILFRTQRVDRFRHEMFKLRDELFVEAGNGLVAFDHPAYCHLRATMNGFIRFAHRLAVWHLLFAILPLSPRVKARAKLANEEWEHLVSDLSDQQKDALGRYRMRMSMTVLMHFLFTPPDAFVVWAGLFATFVWFLLKTVRRRDSDHPFKTAARQTKRSFSRSGSTEELNRMAIAYNGT